MDKLTYPRVEEQLITVNWYQYVSQRTIPLDSSLKDNAANFSMGLCGESGEVSEMLKKHLYHGHPLDKQELEKELGDVMFYLAGLCTLFDLKLSDVCVKNHQKLLKRYPEGFKHIDSMKRVDTL
jgi:NTP pyrophosphatase (non-canonical NTP hydrolase)